LNEQFASGLDRALRVWSRQSGALTVARNGGAEAAMRGQVLGNLEAETDCIAFTEAEGYRVDATLWSNAWCMRAAVEFKHNVLHPIQVSAISRNCVNAVKQLAGARENLRPQFCFYVHFVFELTLQRGSKLTRIHNARVGGSYKEFLREETMPPLREKAQKLLGRPFGVYRLADINGVLTGAALVCWAYQMQGEFPHPLPGPDIPPQWQL
jgi:hypothetical protein